MTYKFVIEKFESLGDDDCDINILSEETRLGMMLVLSKVQSFAAHHPNGYLINGGGHLIEYETDGAELACWVDYDD